MKAVFNSGDFQAQIDINFEEKNKNSLLYRISISLLFCNYITGKNDLVTFYKAMTESNFRLIVSILRTLITLSLN